MVIEEWKDINGYPNYIVSNLGRIMSVRSGKMMAYSMHKKGYHMVGLSSGGKRRKFMVHRIMALSFIPLVYGKDMINHKDCNKLNNLPSNLEWCTHQENVDHCRLNNLLRPCRGEKNGNAKITSEQAKNIKLRRSENRLKLAQEFGVSVAVIKDIRYGRSWKH